MEKKNNKIVYILVGIVLLAFPFAAEKVFNWNYGVLLVVSAICCTPLIGKVWDLLKRRNWTRVLTVALLLVVSTAYVVGSTNSPFLYFNF